MHDVSYPAPWIAEGAEVDLRAHLGRWVAVGPGARDRRGRRRSTTPCSTPGARVGAGARVLRSILAPGAAGGRRAPPLVDSVLGEGAVVPAGLSLDGRAGPRGRRGRAD